jgi:hypothetical protein
MTTPMSTHTELHIPRGRSNILKLILGCVSMRRLPAARTVTERAAAAAEAAEAAEAAKAAASSGLMSTPHTLCRGLLSTSTRIPACVVVCCG